MVKRRVSVAVGLLCVCLSLSAQQVRDANTLGSLNQLSTRVPSLTLNDARFFPFSNSFAWADPTRTDFLPDWRPAGWESNNLNLASTARERRQNRTAGSQSYSTDTSKEVVEVRRSLFDNVHGEVGFLYGRSAGGRYSGDVESGYILGTAGDDKVQISVGAFYENSNVNFPRRGR